MKRLTYSGTKEAKPDVTISDVCRRLCEYEDMEENGLLLKNPKDFSEKLLNQASELKEYAEGCINNENDYYSGKAEGIKEVMDVVRECFANIAGENE